ncbi:MAG: allophanate hydrolase [Caulobacterales bacterium]
MNAANFSRLSATQIAAAVASGAAAASDVIEDSLTRIAAYDAIQPQVWISRASPDSVRAKAAAVDLKVKAGAQLPLAGVPFAVKDNINVGGVETTAACPAFAFTADESARVVQLLEAAGAIFIGKTNLDQFATGLVGARSPYGAPHCVFNHEYVSGGSSSGSAVSVAAGLAAFALGTDTAGSGRVPAAFNHLIGLKPTRGRWSTSGLVPACRSLDCISVFTNDVADARLVDSIVTAYDETDAYSRPAPAPKAAPKKLRIGVPKAKQLNWLQDMQSAKLYEAATARVHEMGATLIEVDITPLLDCAQLLYQGAFVAERTAALKDFAASQPGAMNPVVRGIVTGGRGFSASDAFEAEYQRMDYLRQAAKMWEQIDALLLPTASTIYRIAEVMAEPVALNSNLGLYTNFVNLLDMSAIAAPAGFRANGTGFGVTFIAPAWADAFLLDLAQKYLEAGPAFEIPALDLEPHLANIKVAVVGAHLNGMPLHWQLSSRNARLVKSAKTAPSYKLYAMTQSVPPKPALIYDEGGASIAVEVYELDEKSFGSFTAEVPPPLAIGSVELEDGEIVKGFVAEPRAMIGAEDITHLGGWRAFIAGLKK